MIRYPKILSFKYAAKHVSSYLKFHGNEGEINTKVKYEGTVKLHGTNAGILELNGELFPQSRNRRLTLQSDNQGFATWALHPNVKTQILNLFEKIRTFYKIDSSQALVLYGEWIGPTIQGGMALNQLSSKQWVLFGLSVAEKSEGKNFEEPIPLNLKLFWNSLNPFQKGVDLSGINLYSVWSIPTWDITIDFSSEESLNRTKEQINSWVSEVEVCCPWGKKFGIHGMGEGIVWNPQEDHWGIQGLIFKSKGEKHKVVKGGKKSVDPSEIIAVSEFVDRVVTEPRLNQGLEYFKEMELDLVIQNIPNFLVWIREDIVAECSLELLESGLTWKQVKSAIGNKAAQWYKAQL